jgi:hypothetical protein
MLALPRGLVEREAADTDGPGLAFSVLSRFCEWLKVMRAQNRRLYHHFRGTDFGSTSDLLSARGWPAHTAAQLCRRARLFG